MRFPVPNRSTKRAPLTLRDGQCRTPLIPQDIETDAAVAVDVGVVDLGGEGDLRGLERVIGRESDAEEKDAARVRRVTLVAWRGGVGRRRESLYPSQVHCDMPASEYSRVP